MDIIKKLNAAQSKYQNTIKDAENKIKEKVEFDFSIHYQYSDGWTLVSSDADVCPIDHCIEIIETKGKLSQQDFLAGLI